MSGIHYGAGSGAAGALEDILARRKVEAQQALVNQNAKIEQEHKFKMDDDNAANNKLLRDAQISNMNAQELGRLTELYNPDSDLSPEMAKHFKDIGGEPLVIPEHEETITSRIGKPKLPTPFEDNDSWTPDSPMAPPEPTVTTTKVGAKYYGRPDQRKEVDRKLAEEMLLNDPKTPERLKTFIRAKQVSPTGTVPAWLEEADKHSPAYVEYQDYVSSLPNGKTPISFTQFQDQDANRKRPAPQNTTLNFLGMGANGQPIFANNHPGKDGKPVLSAGEVPGGGPLGPKPSASSAAGNFVPSTILTQLAIAKGDRSSAGRARAHSLERSALRSWNGAPEELKTLAVNIHNDQDYINGNRTWEDVLSDYQPEDGSGFSNEEMATLNAMFGFLQDQ